jgi:two-component system, OmpR family, alkaline phosphatase synthesis response regulator PhoP
MSDEFRLQSFQVKAPPAEWTCDSRAKDRPTPLKRILLVEDDVELLEGLKHDLEAAGYEVLIAPNGEDAVMQVVRRRPAAIIIDLMLPSTGGLEMCQTLRERGIDTPILMLTSRSQEADTIRGLEIGADDYVTRPIGIPDVLARMHVMIRRRTPNTKGAYRFGDVEVHFSRQKVRKGGSDVALSALEFEVLRYFVARKGQIVERDQLLNEVWGYRAFRTTRAVDNLVGRLRQKLERSPHQPKHIVTVYGVGYRFLE